MSKKTSKPSEHDVFAAGHDRGHAPAEAADRAAAKDERRAPAAAADKTSKQPASSPAAGNGLRPWPGANGLVHPSEPDEPLL